MLEGVQKAREEEEDVENQFFSEEEESLDASQLTIRKCNFKNCKYLLCLFVFSRYKTNRFYIRCPRKHIYTTNFLHFVSIF